MQRQALVIGNWKLHGSKAFADALTSDILQQASEVVPALVVCPPAVYLDQLCQQTAGSKLLVGAQNAAADEQGAFTGEIASNMLADIGCQYVILGHSERRQYYGETNEIIAKKLSLALKAGLKPILCVGETLNQRETQQTEQVIAEQLAILEFLHDNGHALEGLIIAYEPCWAIGTGKTATPSEAQAVHQMIRSMLAKLDQQLAQQTPILYGGSVKQSNAENLFAEVDIDGALVGGASLEAQSFIEIAKKWPK